MKRVLAHAPVVAALACFLWNAYTTWQNRGYYLWDAKTYYYAGKAFDTGGDPYDTANVPRITYIGYQQFRYPPLVLPLFAAYSRLSLDTALALALVLKCLLAAGLVALWMTVFLRAEGYPWFPLFCVFAYTYAIHIDVRVGNVSLLEQAALWSAFAFLLSRRPLAFAACLSAAAAFKLLPAAFLLLLLVPRWRPRLPVLAGAAALVVVPQLLAAALAPAAWRGFLAATALAWGEPPLMSPSLFTAAREMAGGARPVAFACFAIAAAFVLWKTVAAFLRPEHSKSPDHERYLIFLSTLAFPLIFPRVADHSYILLLPGTYYVLRRTKEPGTFPLLFAIYCLIPAARVESVAPGPYGPFTLFWKLYPVWLALGAWLLALKLPRSAPHAPDGYRALKPARAAEDKA
jgi:hypothetical protein